MMAGHDLVLYPCSKPSIENVPAVWLGAEKLVLVVSLCSSLTVVSSVLGRYSWKTNLSILTLMSVPGFSSRASLARAFRTESSASRNASQQDNFPFPEGLPGRQKTGCPSLRHKRKVHETSYTLVEHCLTST